MTSMTSAALFDFSVLRITGFTTVFEIEPFSHTESIENSVLRAKKSLYETIYLKIDLN
jgi:hypothetical protein